MFDDTMNISIVERRILNIMYDTILQYMLYTVCIY